MDKDNFFKALLYAAVAFLIFNFFVRFMVGPPPGSEEPPASQPGAHQDIVESSPGTVIAGADTESFVDLGNKEDAQDSPYRSHLRLSTRGAAVTSIRLTDHYATVDDKETHYELVRPLELPGGARYSLETAKVTLSGPGVGSGIVFPLRRANWNVTEAESEDGQRVIFTTDLNYNNAAVVRVTKTYFLPRQSAEDKHSDLQLELAFHNLTDQSIEVIATQHGPVGIPQEDPRTDYRRVTSGILQNGQPELLTKESVGIEDQFSLIFGADDGGLQWVASANKFFAVILAPLPAADGTSSWVEDAYAEALADPEFEEDDTVFKVMTKPLSVAPRGSTAVAFDCYIGPKSKQRFATVEPYSSRNYVGLVNVDYYMCAWTWIVNLMLSLLGAVHSVWPNYGVAIIVMVLVVRVLLHPLTKKGQVNMTRLAEQMQALQPKIEEIRRKHEGDRQRINQETMKLYQTEGVNPAGQMLGCLPMFCQLPIWAALWAALQTTVELRHEKFCLWINDLTAPDQLFSFGTTLPFIGDSFNLLPLLLGLSMWLQNKYMPKPASAGTRTSEQMAQQRMMMTIMSVMMVVIFYNAPSGLTLYIMASNFFGLFEQWRIRKHIAAEKARHEAEGTKPRFQKPKWVQKLEKLAEEAKQQQQQQQQKKKGKRT